MQYKFFIYFFLFVFLVACETGAKEEEKPIELKKEINEKFFFDRKWSVTVSYTHLTLPTKA